MSSQIRWLRPHLNRSSSDFHYTHISLLDCDAFVKLLYNVIEA